MIAITEKTADFSGGLFCIGSLAFEASRFRPCLQKGIAFAVGMCYHHIVNKLIPSSGQGASPYRWYSPRAARHDSVRFRSRQYSLDERRQNAQGSSVCSCVLDDCSGMCSFRSFFVAQGFAHRCLALNLVFGAFLLPTFAGIALMTCKAYLEKRRKTIESKSSGQGASPYRWYSPRAARQIRCNSEADSDSLDGRRRTVQGEVYPPASSVTALGCHTHSGAFCLRKSIACHFCALNLRFRVFLLEVIA